MKLKEAKEQYEKQKTSHYNKWGPTSLSNSSNESLYRDSAKALRDSYANYATAMKEEGKELIPRWI